MPEETMTARERWMAVLEHKIPDRIPMDYWATDEATAKIMKYQSLNTLVLPCLKIRTFLVVYIEISITAQENTKNVYFILLQIFRLLRNSSLITLGRTLIGGITAGYPIRSGIRKSILYRAGIMNLS
jgi:hypothetical protein